MFHVKHFVMFPPVYFSFRVLPTSNKTGLFSIRVYLFNQRKSAFYLLFSFRVYQFNQRKSAFYLLFSFYVFPASNKTWLFSIRVYPFNPPVYCQVDVNLRSISILISINHKLSCSSVCALSAVSRETFSLTYSPTHFLTALNKSTASYPDFCIAQLR